MREAEDTSRDVQEVTGGIPDQTPRAAARLCNFKTGFADLWPEHEDWLRKNVVPILRDPQGAWIDLLAYASARGDRDMNKRLSERRLAEVEKFLKENSGNQNLPVNRNHPFGEELSGPIEKNNSGYFRAVDVYVYGGKKPDIVPPVQLGSKKFKIRCVGGASPGKTVPKTPISLGGDVYFFELVDLDRRLKANFVYGGLGFSITMPKLPDFIPVATGGSFSEFKLTVGSNLADFEGPARLISDMGASIPGHGVGGDIELKFNSVNFIKRGVMVRPTKKGSLPGHIRMDTGPGLSLTLGGPTSGKILMKPKTTFPYHGP